MLVSVFYLYNIIVIITLNVFDDLKKNEIGLKCIDSIKIGKTYSFKFKKYLI